MADLQMSVYDVNKAAMASEKPLDPIQLNQKTAELGKYCAARTYTMLLCRERNDYTVIHSIQNEEFSPASAKQALWIALNNRGSIIAIDEAPGDAYEIWIKDTETEEAFCYYLFDYSMGVMEV